MSQTTNAENWGNFLQPIIVKTIKNNEYRCNNPCILVPITITLLELYKSKNETEMISFLDEILIINKIDLVNDNYFVKISSISGKDLFYVNDDYKNITEFWHKTNILIEKLIMKSTNALCKYLLNSERIAEWIEKDKY